jgi:predicted metalloprotease
MRWQGRRRSVHVDDSRRVARPGVVGGGLGTIVLVLAALYFGVDPTLLLQGLEVAQVGAPAPGGPTGVPADDPQAAFVSVVLADTEDVWQAQFRRAGRSYREPTLVLFSGQVRSACGLGQAAMGPFYCPADQTVYIDLGFYRELRERFRAPGDFAQAYVIAHEVGHHVQNLLGVSERVQALQRRAGARESNALSVRLELQADCLAGVWAKQADRMHDLLEEGDVEEGLRAASAIGDDTLQRQAGGRVVPDSFTHGTSAERVRWFRRGLDTGDTEACDTFTTG